MANREVYPSSLFPLRGDVTGVAGSVDVTVVGIQTESVSDVTPVTAQGLLFNGSEYAIAYINSQFQVNGIAVSDDYTIAVNQDSVRPGILVNGA
jgi:hypothetical protein